MQSTFMQQLMVEKNIILFLEINGVTVYDPLVLNKSCYKLFINIWDTSDIIVSYTTYGAGISSEQSTDIMKFDFINSI